MIDSHDGILTEMEIDALRETMNISFGSAAADLAEIMDIFIQITVPNINTVSLPELSGFIRHKIKDFKSCSIVEQQYNGDFEGIALLVFPYGEAKELISYFHQPEAPGFVSDNLIDLESEVLLEIGNILIGACIGRIFELLDSRIGYQPPQMLLGEEFDRSFLNQNFNNQNLVIIMSTFFRFEDRNATGHMFLINNKKSIPHLKKALSRFLG
ncbi:chemotaxis protein CheC [Oceanispirochaeta sp.]|uniref:chemotaxis protein CheC n=1 Tax=Oceanispirochaeta sp. TaxID=2035350 RepID=UPI00263907E9|nr:chemotaxis protein CheC [Oceanispirochaeta sp.]MDA3956806.1 chemotaxis protein CheC [Oceanispirochaeta sp.]